MRTPVSRGLARGWGWVEGDEAWPCGRAIWPMRCWSGRTSC